MTPETLPVAVHPTGDQPAVEANASPGTATLDTFAGPVKVAWDESSALTPHGQLVYFIEFLKVSGR